MRVRQLARAAMVVAMVTALAACGGSSIPTPSALATGVVPTEAATKAPSPSLSGALSVRATRDVPYESSSLNRQGTLDVFAPVDRDAWPVVVMFHGNPAAPRVDKSYLTEYAQRVAALGFVVFVPTWGKSGGAAYDAMSVKDQLRADGAQAACAVAFAAANAPAYGGDAASLTVFGHSAGGNIGSIVTLASPGLRSGCLATVKPQVDVFMAWEGDWLLITEVWDQVLVDDPSVPEAIAPFAHLPAPVDLRFVFLRGAESEAGREAAGARGPDGWFASRDPDGVFIRALDRLGAFKDGFIGPDDSDAVLIERLKNHGTQVTSVLMPSSDHAEVRSEGWPVFLDAFRAIGVAAAAT